MNLPNTLISIYAVAVPPLLVAVNLYLPASSSLTGLSVKECLLSENTCLSDDERVSRSLSESGRNSHVMLSGVMVGNPVIINVSLKRLPHRATDGLDVVAETKGGTGKR